jgi:lipooligosaccharide transport system ATP-binding protein
MISDAPQQPLSTPAATYQPVVSARNLVKRYGDLVAVNEVSFEVAENACVAFLGPNGAGKTTLMRMVFSLISKSAGDLSVFGLEPMRQRKQINRHLGVVFQENNLDEELAAFDSLLVHALYCGLDHTTAEQRVGELLETMGLSSKRDSMIRELSGGMVRRMMIARALLNSPKLLILDEPTTGLDPQVRHAIWALLRDLKRQGLTILLTTHYMEEAQQLADRVMIMDKGQILLSGSPSDLIKEHLERYVLQISGVDSIPALADDIRHEHAGDADYFYARDESSLQRLYDQFNTPYAVLRHANLEDVFLKFTGHGLNE